MTLDRVIQRMESLATIPVRVAKPEDMADVARLLHAYEKEQDPSIPTLWDIGEEAMAFAENWMKDPLTVVFILGEADGVALLTLIAHPRIWPDESTEAFGDYFYVRPAARGLRAMCSLLMACIRHARERGVRTISFRRDGALRLPDIDETATIYTARI